MRRKKTVRVHDPETWTAITATAFDVDLAEGKIRACIECGKRPTVRETAYIVRGKVWSAAGMVGWDSGYLHEKCLQKRLGRKLTDDDYLLRFVRAQGGAFILEAHRDYLSSPEFLGRSG